MWKRFFKEKCPVCQGVRRDCRQNLTNEQVHCRAGLEPLGWQYLRTDRYGFGVFQENAISSQSSLEWREFKEKKKQARLRELRENEQRAKLCLSPELRDKYYRELLAQLTLDESDREDLLRRGLTPQEISDWGFKSVERWQKLEFPLPFNLPGVNLRGDQLNVPDPGYLCPVIQNSLICGFQIRRRDPGEDGRYRWLTSRTKKRPNGQTPHLKNGELPLLLLPSSNSQGIALVEGTGVKPRWVQSRYQFSVIGAAGGTWLFSPELLTNTLAGFEEKVITLFPDAGDVLNDHVMTRWLRVYQFLKGIGYKIQVAWWGQITKDDDDIDERPVEPFTTISFPRFLKIAKDLGTEDQVAKSLQILDAENETQQYHRLTQLTKQPWRSINTSKIDLEALNLERGAIYILCSAKGTGKTNALKKFLQSFENIFAWFNRVSLAREASKRVGLLWREDLGPFSGSLKVSFCSNSSFKFNPALLKNNGLLLIDEVDQVFDHNFGATCNQGGIRPLILNALQAQIDAAIAGGGTCLLMSADITDKEVEYIEQLAPEGVPVRLIVNTYLPSLGKVLLDTSKTPEANVKRLIEKLEAGQPCFVVDDLKSGVNGCKSIAQYIRTIHPEWDEQILEINGDTSGDPIVIEQLQNINEASKSYRLICCSPSVTSGISLENGRFAEGVFGFFSGVLVVSQAAQAIARVRGANNIHLWAAEKGIGFLANRSCDPEEIKNWYQRNYEKNCRFLLAFSPSYNPLSEEWESPHFSLYCKNTALRNACMRQFRERLREKLESEGYQVEEREGTKCKETYEQLKAAWFDIDLIRAEQVANAELLDDCELDRLLSSQERLDPATQIRLEKSLLKRTFGEKLIAEMHFEHPSGTELHGYAAMYLKNQGGRYARALQSLFLLQSAPELAAGLDLKREEQQITQSSARFAGDVRWYSRQRQARKWLELDTFLDLDRWIDPIDVELLGTQARSRAFDLHDALNINVAKLKDAQIYTELLLQLGLETEWRWQTNPATQKRYRQRRIKPQSWYYAQLYLDHRMETLKNLRTDHPHDSKHNNDRCEGDRECTDSNRFAYMSGFPIP